MLLDVQFSDHPDVLAGCQLSPMKGSEIGFHGSESESAYFKRAN